MGPSVGGHITAPSVYTIHQRSQTFSFIKNEKRRRVVGSWVFSDQGSNMKCPVGHLKLPAQHDWLNNHSRARVNISSFLFPYCKADASKITIVDNVRVSPSSDNRHVLESL
ncbi:hypothetical protein CBL_00018 [Carabus blaptoides fortunei]